MNDPAGGGRRISPILAATTCWLLPLILIFSVFLLLRGHDEPGGGFAGGLVASTAFLANGLVRGVDAARAMLRADPLVLVCWGLGLALLAGMLALVGGREFLSAGWGTVLGVKLGTPLIFDVGVYLLVIGAVTASAWRLQEAERPWTS